MRNLGFVLVFFLLQLPVVADADEPDFVLEEMDPDLESEGYAVQPDSAFRIAREYGINPELGQISVALFSDRDFGLCWNVGYVDWTIVEGINGYIIDAVTGQVMECTKTHKSGSKKRDEYVADEAELLVDSCPPMKPIVRFASARRGFYPEGPCVLRGQVMNASRGIIEANVLELSDDRTPPEEMALLLENLGGSHPLPDDWGPQVPVYPRIKCHQDSLMIFVTWNDGNDEFQEKVSNKFAIYAIDKAGNRSTEADTLVVELPGG